MKILTISFFDDNFGDMLIRICFDRLLTVAMKNLGYSDGDFVIDNMHIKEIDEEKIASADLILFSGGAMFGFNNLGSFDAIDAITAIAEKKGIPVVFSSLGINNMHADEESGARLNAILTRKCVRAMSVRESVDAFTPFTEGCGFEVVSVCDPAVWTKHIYRNEIMEIKRAKKRRTVGLNVVRGGLFKANGKKWTLDDEAAYFKGLVKLFDEKGIDYRFFTNGSVLDNNSMAYIAKQIGVSDDKLISPDSTREVVRAIAGFDTVLAIRMHSAIISYALDIPSLDIVWNEKIPYFYKNIGYPDRALEMEFCTPEVVLRMTQDLLEDRGFKADESYLMSLYDFLYKTLGTILKKPADSAYSFADVSHLMSMQESGITDDVTDYRTKIRRGRYCYQTLFSSDMERRAQIRSLKKEVKEMKKLADEYKEKYEELAAQTEEDRKKLFRINHFFPVRVYHKLFKRKKK
ncbi:MAG: polysaccharide pyruvyl transferase family protein [Ruminococcus sp.]|nr:polysaccharide pyruvyl transferase family protein [Ruminococcus sp.]